MRSPGLTAILSAPAVMQRMLRRGPGFYFDFPASGIPSGASIASVQSQPGSELFATQGTAGKRPSAQDSIAGLIAASFDAADDSLATSLVPSTNGMVLAATYRLSGAGQVLMGSQTAAGDRCYLGINGVGQLGGGWGSQGSSTITDGVEGRNAIFVGMLRATATRVEIWRYTPSTGALTNGYGAAASGAPNTTLGLEIGAVNLDGAAASFTNARIWRAFAGQITMEDSEILPFLKTLARGF